MGEVHLAKILLDKEEMRVPRQLNCEVGKECISLGLDRIVRGMDQQVGMLFHHFELLDYLLLDYSSHTLGNQGSCCQDYWNLRPRMHSHSVLQWYPSTLQRSVVLCSCTFFSPGHSAS